MIKIFVDVKTPGNGKTYDFQLDSAITVGQAKAKMIDEITDIENGNITLKFDKVMLCNLNTKVQLNDADTLKMANVKSGQSLLFF